MIQKWWRLGFVKCFIQFPREKTTFFCCFLPYITTPIKTHFFCYALLSSHIYEEQKLLCFSFAINHDIRYAVFLSPLQLFSDMLCPLYGLGSLDLFWQNLLFAMRSLLMCFFLYPVFNTLLSCLLSGSPLTLCLH